MENDSVGMERGPEIDALIDLAGSKPDHHERQEITDGYCIKDALFTATLSKELIWPEVILEISAVAHSTTKNATRNLMRLSLARPRSSDVKRWSCAANRYAM